MMSASTTGVSGYATAGFAAALVLCGLTAHGQEKTLSGEPGPAATRVQTPPSGVCPPFQLRDEQGKVINPVAGENADKPYSPKQTCGECHDYEKITQGFHFMQGKGEQPTADQKTRCLWASTPGNYGGTWCSPAPLYKYLSPKKNESAALIDMTSFAFFTSPCGACHPGGGSAEFDREGKRYDLWMSDPASGLSSGGDNNFDGDYYKARWSETGVLEADCLLCHLPEYDISERKKQLGAWNFRWAATAGAGFAKVTGSVSDSNPVEVAYEKELFNDDGTVEPHIVREPRNEVCLSCHAKPGWKKRGANFSPRTDVHLRAGLKCVDCHPAGSAAADPRIAGHEEHQFGKGDDPGGHVRDDLDDTCVSCADCHDTGKLGAPVARHRWLPPLHLDQIACQTCHIPQRLVMPIQVQASDVFNAAPKIDQPGKRLWTFYGPDGKYRNHYGYLNMMGYDDKPTESFRPKLVRYKGKIYPANRIHSAWPGIEVEGETALMQPKMGDIYKMWSSHRADAAKYPELSKIADDNGDGVPEVNRPEEIDALIQSVGQMLAEIKYAMEGKRVVWVMDDRVYASGTEFRTLDMHPWEASPYANVHKYNHDIYPAKAALGSGGCRECHSADSPFFFDSALGHLFDGDGKPVTVAQYKLLGYDGKPRKYVGVVGGVAAFFRWLTIVVMIGLCAHIVLDFATRWRVHGTEHANREGNPGSAERVLRFNTHFLAQHFLLILGVGLLFLSGIFLWGLRYPGAAWAAALSGAWGGVDIWRVVHRVGGSLLILVALYHLIYSLVHPEGRRDFVLLLPRWEDFRHFGQNLLRFVGARRERPRFGRFTYFEKFDYWAVYWGSVIMIATGLVMWFPSIGRCVAPARWSVLLDACKEAHAHEALLAFLAIIIWHVYNVHLRPGRFPGSLVFLHGQMSRAEMALEHPLATHSEAGPEAKGE